MDINSALGVTFIATVLSLAAAISLFSSATAFAQENQQYSFVKKWGSEGIGFGRFAQPIDIAIDSSGNLYVTDLSSISNKIQKFTSNGTFITAWGNLGFGPGRFTSPAGIDVGTLDIITMSILQTSVVQAQLYKYLPPMVHSLGHGVLMA